MKLKIEGMSCEHCVAAVREALTDVDGVVTAPADRSVCSSQFADVHLDHGRTGKAER